MPPLFDNRPCRHQQRQAEKRRGSRHIRSPPTSSVPPPTQQQNQREHHSRWLAQHGPRPAQQCQRIPATPPLRFESKKTQQCTKKENSRLGVLQFGNPSHRCHIDRMKRPPGKFVAENALPSERGGGKNLRQDTVDRLEPSPADLLGPPLQGIDGRFRPALGKRQGQGYGCL